VVKVFLSIIFDCGLFIAVAHIANKKLIARVYDDITNLQGVQDFTRAHGTRNL
jgi:hypothetical protein